MIPGNPQAWAEKFKSADQRLIERILFVWPQCLLILPSQPLEDFITANLVNLLSKDIVARRIGYLEYQYVPFGMKVDRSVFGKGYIDFAVILDSNRESYVAYECKRLNIQSGKSRSSLATKYVTEGMMRYVKEQYAEGLPFACMLGYVVDGDMAFACQRIWKAIKEKKSELGLLSGPNPIGNLEGIQRFFTGHKRTGSSQLFEIRHALLSCNNSDLG